MDFYKHLNYSLGNEDWNVEQQALEILPGDKAICITASGDRPLHLLMTNCSEVISLDMNHIQNYLLKLKLAAITHLDYDKYLAFLGCTPCKNRYEILQQLTPHMDEKAAHYWLGHRKLIERGIVYQGRTEKFTNLSAKFIKLFRKRSIKRLMEFDNIEEQRAYVNRHWDTRSWRLFFEIMANPKFSKILLDDPGLNSYIEYTRKPGKYIYDRMLRYLNTHLARESALLQLILMGRVSKDAYFPYLTEGGYNKIRANKGKLTIKTVSVIDHLLNMPANSIDCFSLSDIASYMPQDAFEKLLAGVYSAGKPGARFCLREFMSNRIIPENLQSCFLRKPELEHKLEHEEKNFVYRFMVGNLHKDH